MIFRGQICTIITTYAHVCDIIGLVLWSSWDLTFEPYVAAANALVK